MPPRTNTHEHAADRRDATKSEPAASEPTAARRYHARLPGLECAENLVKKRFWFRVLSRECASASYRQSPGHCVPRRPVRSYSADGTISHPSTNRSISGRFENSRLRADRSPVSPPNWSAGRQPDIAPPAHLDAQKNPPPSWSRADDRRASDRGTGSGSRSRDPMPPYGRISTKPMRPGVLPAKKMRFGLVGSISSRRGSLSASGSGNSTHSWVLGSKRATLST